MYGNAVFKTKVDYVWDQGLVVTACPSICFEGHLNKRNGVLLYSKKGRSLNRQVDRKLPEVSGEVTKTKWSGWWFDSRPWNLHALCAILCIMLGRVGKDTCVLFGSLFVFFNFYRLDIHRKNRVALTNLWWNICKKKRIKNQTSLI